MGALQGADGVAHVERIAEAGVRALCSAVSASPMNPMSDSARALTRIGLASYFAGALVLPYHRSCRRRKTCATTSSCWRSVSVSLWVVYEAFSQPDKILIQLARMPYTPDEKT